MTIGAGSEVDIQNQCVAGIQRCGRQNEIGGGPDVLSQTVNDLAGVKCDCEGVSNDAGFQGACVKGEKKCSMEAARAITVLMRMSDSATSGSELPSDKCAGKRRNILRFVQCESAVRRGLCQTAVLINPVKTGSQGDLICS